MAWLTLILTILGLLGPTLWNISGLRKEFRNPGDKRLSDRTVGEKAPLSVEILMKSVLRENTVPVRGRNVLEYFYHHLFVDVFNGVVLEGRSCEVAEILERARNIVKADFVVVELLPRVVIIRRFRVEANNLIDGCFDVVVVQPYQLTIHGGH